MVEKSDYSMDFRNILILDQLNKNKKNGVTSVDKKKVKINYFVKDYRLE